MAEYFIQPESVEEIIEAEKWANENKIKISVISGGTNSIISDDGIKGLVIHLGKFRKLESNIEDGKLKITSYAGTPKAQLFKEFLKYKLAPALFLAGIPGDVGGGVVMNAGVGDSLSPREFVEIIDWVEVLRDGRIIKFNKFDLRFEYRHSSGWQPGIITSVGFSWSNEPDESILTKVRELTKIRMEKQPLEFPNSGSVFKNPPNKKSGLLIEECGLKGFRIGDAQISEKHANFIVNRGKATTDDIKKLVAHIQKTVQEKKSVQLEPEWVFF